MCKWNIFKRDVGHFFIDWFNVLWGKDTWLKEDLKKKKEISIQHFLKCFLASKCNSYRGAIPF